MWNLYSKDDNGIALKTDSKSLIECLEGIDNAYVGKVKYLDYSTTFVRENHPLAPFMCKRKSFEHEVEVRAIIRLGSLNDVTRMPVPCDTGVLQNVDLESLVKEVVVSPQSSDWFLELVESTVVRYGFNIPVHRSSLDDDPVW